MGEPSLAVALAKAWIRQLYDAAVRGDVSAVKACLEAGSEANWVKVVRDGGATRGESVLLAAALRAPAPRQRPRACLGWVGCCVARVGGHPD